MSQAFLSIIILVQKWFPWSRFSLSIPKISLKTSLGIPKYKDKDTYLLNGEELVKNTSVHPKHEGNYVVTEYLQRVEGTYSLIKHCIASDSSSYWEVTTTKNHTSILVRHKHHRYSILSHSKFSNGFYLNRTMRRLIRNMFTKQKTEKMLLIR